MALLLKVIGKCEARTRIGQGYNKDPPAPEVFPAKVHEQGHRAYGNQPAHVIKNVREVETRPGGRQGFQESKEPVSLFPGNNIFCNSQAEVFLCNFHWSITNCH